MKLSEAIRLGSMLKPQGQCFLFHDGRTCAVGAALDAVGLLDAVAADESGNCDSNPHPVTAARFPIAALIVDAPRVVNMWHMSDSVNSVIAGLNDSAGWSREQIADWVETIEQAQEAESRRAVAASVAETETVTTAVRHVPQN